MGCDIHMVLERKVADGRWLGLHNFPYGRVNVHSDTVNGRADAAQSATGSAYWYPRQRSYDFFAAIADVRSEENQRGPDPKGIPEDASELARWEIAGWGEDGHSHSWMTLEEMLPIYMKVRGLTVAAVKEKIRQDEFPRATNQALQEFGVFADEVDGDLFQFRVVFWFDN